jgi:hypothetical protein
MAEITWEGEELAWFCSVMSGSDSWLSRCCCASFLCWSSPTHTHQFLCWHISKARPSNSRLFKINEVILQFEIIDNKLAHGWWSDTVNTEIYSHFSQTCHDGTCNIDNKAPRILYLSILWKWLAASCWKISWDMKMRTIASLLFMKFYTEYDIYLKHKTTVTCKVIVEKVHYRQV